MKFKVFGNVKVVGWTELLVNQIKFCFSFFFFPFNLFLFVQLKLKSSVILDGLISQNMSASHFIHKAKKKKNEII